MRIFIGKEINVPFQCKGIRQLITLCTYDASYKKLTCYARRMGTGTGIVLRTGVVWVWMWALCRPYCSTEVEARRFRTSVGHGIDEDPTEKRKL